MHPSRQSRLGYGAVRWGLGPLVRHAPMTETGYRLAAGLDHVAALRPQPAGIVRERVSLRGFDAEIVRPTASRADLQDGVVLYFHGGGFVICGLNTHRPVVANIAKATGLPVMNVAYRQLPKTDLAGSTADCLAAYRWLLARGVDPKRVVFAGDSAGGFLVFATALHAIEEGLPAPGGLVGISGWYDLDAAAKADHPNAHRDPLIPMAALATIAARGAGVDGVIDPMSSPVNGNLAELPPALLIAAESEVLRVDAELMASRLHAAGVPCELQIWDGQVHAFPSVYPSMKESKAAVREIGHFVTSRLADSKVRAGRIA